MERTLVLIKPDAVLRGLVGEITRRFERRGLSLEGCKMIMLSKSAAAEHYAHLVGRPFFPRIEAYMTELGPIVAQCWAGVGAVALVREMVGVTNSREAAPGTIRGDLALSIQFNVVHASEDKAASSLEVSRFFLPEELHRFEAPFAGLLSAEDEQ